MKTIQWGGKRMGFFYAPFGLRWVFYQELVAFRDRTRGGGCCVDPSWVITGQPLFLLQQFGHQHHTSTSWVDDKLADRPTGKQM